MNTMGEEKSILRITWIIIIRRRDLRSHIHSRYSSETIPSTEKKIKMGTFSIYVKFFKNLKSLYNLQTFLSMHQILYIPVPSRAVI